jgi:hypothetical protein
MEKLLHFIAAVGISLSLFAGVIELANPVETEQAVCTVFRAPIDHLPPRQPLVMLAMR